MATQSIASAPPPNGLQPFDPMRHLDQVASVLEVGFSNEMGSEGARAATREMRRYAAMGWPVQIMLWLKLTGYLPIHGMVWREAGRVVGTASTQPADADPGTWLVANVAVLPEYRRRGIAEAVTRGTLDLIRRKHGRRALLQVDDDNLPAQRLYEKIGFTQLATRAHYTRASHSQPPDYLPSRFEIRLRDEREWMAEYDLARLVCPEGLTWGRALRVSDFRVGLGRTLLHVLSGTQEERWAAFTPDNQMAGALRVVLGSPEGDQLRLLVHPALRGQVERPLLIRGLRRVGVRPWTLQLECQANDPDLASLLTELGFVRRRCLRWMAFDLT
jgi:ribosomal protein S18 acetylase RimI-like enzyme